jgi:tRNA-dihydrouridine synthase
VNLVARTGPGARDGPAHLDQISAIKDAVPEKPIIANGNVITWNDIVRNLEFTGADGTSYVSDHLNTFHCFTSFTYQVL